MADRALFLDRDGVVNREIGYLFRKEDVTFVEGIFSLCKTAKQLGYRLVIVTNQAGIARGLYTEGQYHELMQWMRGEFKQEGVVFDGTYHCPYHPEHGIGQYKRDHEDRKPGAGMLRRAARDLGIDLPQSVLVGDRCTDILAANAGGLKQAFLISGTENAACSGIAQSVDALSEVEKWLVAQK